MKMSAKVAISDGSSGGGLVTSTNSASLNNSLLGGTSLTTTNTNGATQGRRLRTRTSTGSGNMSGGESAKKNGPLTERTNYSSDLNSNVTTACPGVAVGGGGSVGSGVSTGIGGVSLDEKPTISSNSATTNGNSNTNGNSGSGIGTGTGGNVGGGCGGSTKKYHNSCPHPTITASARKNYASHSQPHSSSTFNMNKTEEFNFDTPQECPVFRPTPEEFKNPLAYINKIRPIAEKHGIAKILPPDSWSPPFAVDVDKLKFTPRVQRLNELEAKTRVKLNFLDQIAKFWELQGSSLKIPMVERKALDLYTLHRIVQEEGGMEQTTRERKWAKVATRMSYPSSKSVGATLKAHYERILHPFEVYTSGKVLGASTPTAAAAASAEAAAAIKMEDGTDYKAHEIPTRQQIAPPNENNARRSKRFANSSANCGLGAAKNAKLETKEDFKRDLLACFNAIQAGPGRAGSGNNGTGGGVAKKSGDSQALDPLMKYICHICNRGDVEESMLLCDGCDDSYHTFCLFPPLSSIPKGEWLCPRCVVEEVSKPTEAFGFEQAEREYTLQQFGQMADQFKMDYFRRPVHLVTPELVEREFWRIVSSIDEDVTVEYGADLHTMDHGSGFPTKSSLYLLPGDQEYAESSWNLNNLPLLEDSILGHINADISGMNAPWMYVGMCFAAFCWHNEDHWSYSINYLHWGEPKTWYGVPGSCAEQFEETMKQAAPELFASQPDLLHQLVTIMNPNILMNNGVPVYRTDQNAGEFVITFPRAYHAGFNQGYNFAEAVNFAPADWLKMGRECVNHYSMLRRFCVFSHDELVCKMALEPAKLTFGIATACYIDMAEMVDSEKKLRKSLLEWGVTRAERKAFELVPDDERHCHECNTTCFLSAVSCECTKSIVCLRHYTVLCQCPPERHTLLYRYTLDEMPLMLQKLKSKAQSFERWLARCRDIVDASTPTTVTLSELQELCKEAEIKKFPTSLLVDRLNSAVVEAEKCVTVIQQLGINKVRTRSDNSLDAAQYKLTMEELELFVQEIDNLCCIIDEGTSVRELLVLGRQFVERANLMENRSLNTIEEQELEALVSEGNSLRIELNQMPFLTNRLKQLKWYKRAHGMRTASTKLTYADIQNLLTAAGTDMLPTDVYVEKEIHKLKFIGAAIEAWEKQAGRYLQSTVQQTELMEIDQFLRTAVNVEGHIPSYALLRDALRKARDWLRSVEQLQANDHFPYCHTLEAIVAEGRNIPIQLDELLRMEGHLLSAKEWKSNTARTFLKKGTFYTLLEVLMPRAQPVTIDSSHKKPFQDDFVKEMNPAQIVESFKQAEEKELRDMRDLRRRNMEKNPLRDNYCLCKSKFHGVMYNCQLCRDWFHESCVPQPPAPPSPQSPTTANMNGNLLTKPKWLCSSCVRSKRPRLETILPLLVSLQRLPIRLPEDEALRCLAERAMSWQDRARKALTSPDVTAAIEAIMSHLQVTRQKRKPSGARKQRHTSQVGNVNNPDNPDTDDDDEGRLHIVEDDDGFSNEDEDSATCDDVGAEAELQKLLSDSETENLAELMMEGDLLEVSLDEALELWRILSTVQPTLPPEAVALIKQGHVLHKSQNPSSAGEDSNDSLLVQSSPNSGSQSGRNNNNHTTARKRRSIDPATGCPVQRKKLTPNKQTTILPAAITPNNNNTNTTTNVNTNTISSTTTVTKKSRKQDLSKQNLTIDDCYIETPIIRHQIQSNGGGGGGGGNNNNNSNNLNNSNHLTSTGPKKRKQRLGHSAAGGVGTGNTSSAGTGGNRKNTQRQLITMQDDDEEECRAENCHKPTGREVDWVQCDGGCNEWFHMYCVGLNRSQIKADDDYICIRCAKTVAAVTTTANATSTTSSSTNTVTTTTPTPTSISSTNTVTPAPAASLYPPNTTLCGITIIKAAPSKKTTITTTTAAAATTAAKLSTTTTAAAAAAATTATSSTVAVATVAADSTTTTKNIMKATTTTNAATTISVTSTTTNTKVIGTGSGNCTVSSNSNEAASLVTKTTKAKFITLTSAQLTAAAAVIGLPSIGTVRLSSTAAAAASASATASASSSSTTPATAATVAKDQQQQQKQSLLSTNATTQQIAATTTTPAITTTTTATTTVAATLNNSNNNNNNTNSSAKGRAQTAR